MTGNVFSSKKQKIGGGFHVWQSVDRNRLVGGNLYVPAGQTLTEYYGLDTVIPAGTAVYLPQAGAQAKILQTFELAEAITATSTVLSFLAGGNVPQLKSGMAIMVAPDKFTETGDAISTGTVVKNPTTGYLEVTITANALGVLPAGTVFVKAQAAGTDQRMEDINPNGFTMDDIPILEGAFYATVTVSTHGVLREDLVSPIPQFVKDKLPTINFEKGV